MKNSENIEKFFKDTFEHFEADVNPQVWTNVQNSINAPAAGTVSAGSKLALGKIITGVVSVAVVSGGIFYALTKEDKIVPSTSEKTRHAQKEVMVQNNQSVPVAVDEQPTQPVQAPANNSVIVNDRPGSSTPPAVRNLNHYTPDYSPVQQTRMTQPASDNAVYSDVAAIESSSPAPAAKYGPATQGMGGMIRGVNMENNPGSNSSSGESSQEDAEIPGTSIFFNTSSGDAPLTVDFIAQGNASSVTWDFGDGSGSRENDPSHTFTKPGYYTVELTSKNGHGTSTDKVTIEVKATSSVGDIPNIFTPNGDGDNDVFYFREMKNITSIGVAIISDRGELITQWNNLEGNWNGKLRNGSDAPDGVYLYSIRAIGADGVTHSEKGFVTISR